MRFHNRLMRRALAALHASNAHKSDQDVERRTRRSATCPRDLQQIRIREAKVAALGIFFLLNFRFSKKGLVMVKRFKEP